MCQKSAVDVLLSLLSSSDPSKHDLTQEFMLLNRIPSDVVRDMSYNLQLMRGLHRALCSLLLKGNV